MGCGRTLSLVKVACFCRQRGSFALGDAFLVRGRVFLFGSGLTGLSWLLRASRNTPPWYLYRCMRVCVGSRATRTCQTFGDTRGRGFLAQLIRCACER